MKFLIIVEQFVERRQNREREKKINKFKKISNIEKLKEYKRLLILILRESLDYITRNRKIDSEIEID